jgi:hypothetical protein
MKTSILVVFFAVLQSPVLANAQVTRAPLAIEALRKSGDAFCRTIADAGGVSWYRELSRACYQAVDDEVQTALSILSGASGEVRAVYVDMQARDGKAFCKRIGGYGVMVDKCSASESAKSKLLQAVAFGHSPQDVIQALMYENISYGQVFADSLVHDTPGFYPQTESRRIEYIRDFNAMLTALVRPDIAINE